MQSQSSQTEDRKAQMEIQNKEFKTIGDAALGTRSGEERRCGRHQLSG